MDVFYCFAAAWTTDQDAYMLDCPDSPPEVHTDCLCAAHQLNEGCVNLHCFDGEPSGLAVCDDESKQWIEQLLPCNPPAADAGDADGREAADGAGDGDDAGEGDAPPDGESGP